jgi:hypothetical protein
MYKDGNIIFWNTGNRFDTANFITLAIILKSVKEACVSIKNLAFFNYSLFSCVFARSCKKPSLPILGGTVHKMP